MTPKFPTLVRRHLNRLQGKVRALSTDLKRLSLTRTLALGTSTRDFLREPLTVPRAEEAIQHALDHRDENFLEIVRTRIYESPDSPYLRLLKIAGCEFPDLRALVRRSGVDRALERLAKDGVYLTSDEFKGNTHVVRRGQSFRVVPDDFLRQDAQAGFTGISSGTKNRPVRTFITFDWLAMRAQAMAVFLSAHDLHSYAHAVYDGTLPASAGMNNLLLYAKAGLATNRWFARKIPGNTWLESPYYLLATHVIVLAGKRFGPGFPRPEFIDIQDVHRIVRWVGEQGRKGHRCCITAAASNAIRVARVAWEMSASLSGTKFIMSGEPFTESKRQLLERVGGSGTGRYAYGGGMNIGFGCARGRHTDDVHVNEHLLALLAHPEPLPSTGPQIHPLMCTTLNPLSPRMLLNVQNGDYAALERRECGCALGTVGLTLHVSRIRSFEKFTSEGTNYFYGDLFPLFEEILPAEFGGSPGDYQLVEEEDGAGQTRLTVVVHPQVGALSEERLLSRLREALAEGSKGNRIMAGIWRSAGTLRVRRDVPHASPRGKILPLHIPR